MQVAVVGVAGGTGSGKTTVANAILGQIPPDQIVCIQHDSYYRAHADLPLGQRAALNYDHPDSLENELLVAHLSQLRRNEPVNVPIYDFTTHLRLAETRRVGPTQVVLVEGILIFADKALRDMMDVRIYVDTDSDIRFIRRLRRDIAERGRTLESVIRQYLETVRPMHLEFVEPSKRYADVIIPEGGFNTIAVDMVVARLQGLLAGEGFESFRRQSDATPGGP